MSNSQITKKFFSVTDAKTKNAILASIAKHYGISNQAALDEVIDDEAESLCDYLMEPIRSATYLLMKRHGLA